MSSHQAMRGLLQARLMTLGWETQTAFEGKGFVGAQPDAATPYQEVSTFFATPDDDTLAGSSGQRGEFQVRILWPLTDVRAQGIGAPTARAEEIKAAFPRNLVLTSGGQRVKVMSSAHISRGPVQGDRDVTVVRLRFGDR